MFKKSRHLETNISEDGIFIAEVPDLSNLIPKYRRYKPPILFTTVNQKADTENKAPNPTKEANNAVESPSATPATNGIFAQRPCATEFAITAKIVGPGMISMVIDATTKASQTSIDMELSPSLIDIYQSIGDSKDQSLNTQKNRPRHKLQITT